MKQSTLVILALDQALPSALIGIADLLSLAGLSQQAAHGRLSPGPGDPIGWQASALIASQDGGSITDGQGRELAVDCSLADIADCDGVIIPGFVPCDTGLPPSRCLQPSGVEWLERQQRRQALLGGSCSGAFALGEAGLLDGRRCTTTWWLHHNFAERFPRAQATWGSALIQDGQIITAGGPLSWVDICLRMIRCLAGPDIANRAADFSVVDAMPSSQDKYIPQGHICAGSPFLITTEQKIRENLDRALTTTELASLLAISERTLHRRLKQHTGESPKTFIDRVRMDMAKTLLFSSTKHINQIAMDFGYEDPGVFRRLFRKQVGMSPSAYRQWQQQRQ